VLSVIVLIRNVLKTLKASPTQYRTLAKIARDYLAIQGSSVSSERAFSGGGLTDTKARNQLSPETFEALQILKSCYKDGLIKVEDEVASTREETICASW